MYINSKSIKSCILVHVLIPLYIILACIMMLLLALYIKIKVIQNKIKKKKYKR
jgi:hypothetical protein